MTMLDDLDRVARHPYAAGLAGSLVSLRFAPGDTWRARAVSVLLGSLTAAYVAPTAGPGGSRLAQSDRAHALAGWRSAGARCTRIAASRSQRQDRPQTRLVVDPSAQSNTMSELTDCEMRSFWGAP